MGAWIETSDGGDNSVVGMSLPMWERGLKPRQNLQGSKVGKSLPMWERGLKPAKFVSKSEEDKVAPHVGAWIETEYGPRAFGPHMSLPMWERGLKH